MRGGMGASLIPAGELLWEDEYLLTKTPVKLSGGLSPFLGWRLGRYFSAGAELQFLWLSAGEAERRLLVRPHGRARASFPLDCRWSVTGLFGTGPTLWSEWRGVQDEARRARRWGWGFRFAFGFEFKLNREVTLGLTGGLLQESSWGDEVDGELGLYPIEFSLAAQL